MRGDPLPPVSGPVPPIRLHTTRFFDSQCSNDLRALRITHRDSGEECDHGLGTARHARWPLRTLAESALANAIGVSTLAVTADGAFVLVRQSRLNAGSPMLLAPSGSGSLDPRIWPPPDRDPAGHPAPGMHLLNSARRRPSGRMRSKGTTVGRFRTLAGPGRQAGRFSA